MTGRKNYIINKKFQLKKTFTVLSLAAATMFIISFIMGSVILLNKSAIEKNNHIINSTNNELKIILKTQEELLKLCSAELRNEKNPSKRALIKKVMDDYEASKEKIQRNIRFNDHSITMNSASIRNSISSILISIAVAIAGIAVLYLRMIRETHRISGPIYLMSRHIREIQKGKYPDMRDLRQDDEFHEFYNLFRELAERIIKLENRKEK